MKQKILILKGLPASGKSTYARKLVDSDPSWKRVNRDDLRKMIDNGRWSKKNEELVVELRNTIIVRAVIDGFNVVVDDTNLSPKNLSKIKELVKTFGVKCDVEEMFFDVPVSECVRRDLERQNSVGSDVICGMYNQFLFKPEKRRLDRSLPLACIFDIDGTLATATSRSHYEWSRVDEDKVNTEVAFMAQSLKRVGVKILVVSGRDGSCRDATADWLLANDIPFDALFMRPAGNNESDDIIKERIYRESIEKEFCVTGVFDDRPKVIRAWKKLGLFVFGCNQDCYPQEF